MTKQDLKKLAEYYIVSAERDWQAFLKMKRGKLWMQSLFFLHLSIEKKLKALIVVRRKQHPPYSHQLGILAGKTDCFVPEATAEDLNVITTFNISSRYPDENDVFFKIATREYVAKWQKKGKAIHQWLDRELNQS